MQWGCSQFGEEEKDLDAIVVFGNESELCNDKPPKPPESSLASNRHPPNTRSLCFPNHKKRHKKKG